MFHRKNTVLMIIDLQERLVPYVQNANTVVTQTKILMGAARILGIPLLVTEQYPEGIGPTIPELKSLLSDTPIISKRAFSCCREPRVMAALEALQRRQILICGIETHVCVFQTAADLIERGYQAQVATEAVSSRTEANKALGLTRIQHAGGAITSVESSIFELLETSACPEFKQILKLIKRKSKVQCRKSQIKG